MKCEGCGKELANDAKVCDACGRKVGAVQHTVGETKAVTGKIGRGLMSGMKSLESDVKKVGKKKDEPSAEPPPPPPPPPAS
jgi:hypothetical protein